MKKTLLITFAASAILCACAKEQTSPSAPGTSPAPGELTISASAETDAKTSLNGTKVFWQKDSMVVYNTNLAGAKFTTTVADSQTADFTTTTWVGGTPEYAASYCPSYLGRMVFTAPSKGVMPVEIRATAAIGWANTFSKQAYASVGKVVEDQGTYSVEMKNVMGLIEVTFTDASIKKIVATAIGGEQMTGWVNVDYEKLAAGDASFWTPVEGKTISTTSTATMTKAGKYYIPVLPQTYSNGIRLQALDGSNAVVVERTIGAKTGVTIKRNEITPLAKNIDEVELPPLPNTVVLDLVFNNPDGINPLGTFKAVSQQTKAGDSYTFGYKYSVDGKDYTKNFTFVIGNKTSSGYKYAPNTGLPYSNNGMFTTGDKNIWMQVPGIEGKYLSTVTVKMGNAYTSADRLVRIKKDPAQGSITQMKPTVATEAGPVPTSIHFYADGNDGITASLQGNKTEKGVSYYLIFADTFNVDTITLTYTNELPTR